jgi:hypothetical protein
MRQMGLNLSASTALRPILPERKPLDVLHDDALQLLQCLGVGGFGPQAQYIWGRLQIAYAPVAKGYVALLRGELHCEFMAPMFADLL